MTMPPELAAYLDRHPETRFVDAVLYDLCGTAIGKRVPVRDAAKLWSGGVAFCAGITTLDACPLGRGADGAGADRPRPARGRKPLVVRPACDPWHDCRALCRAWPASGRRQRTGVLLRRPQA